MIAHNGLLWAAAAVGLALLGWAVGAVLFCGWFAFVMRHRRRQGGN